MYKVVPLRSPWIGWTNAAAFCLIWGTSCSNPLFSLCGYILFLCGLVIVTVKLLSDLRVLFFFSANTAFQRLE